MKTAQYLYYWGSTGFVFIALIAVFPEALSYRIHETATGDFFSAALAIIIGGFYLRMILECLKQKADRHRALWLLFLIAIPIISGYVYFFITNSIYYKSKESKGSGTGLNFP